MKYETIVIFSKINLYCNLIINARVSLVVVFLDIVKGLCIVDKYMSKLTKVITNNIFFLFLGRVRKYLL